MTYDAKEVYFAYCTLCKHAKLKETESPCDECLQQPVNENSHKPVYFSPAKKETTINDAKCKCISP